MEAKERIILRRETHIDQLVDKLREERVRSVIEPILAGQVQRVVLELKTVHGSLSRTIEEGLEQTWEYMDRRGADEGHLVVFDRDSEKAWEEKIFKREKIYQGMPITVWGM